jgi:hypothetical protein
MKDFFDNEVIMIVFATLVVVVILALFGWFKFKRDEKIVMEFLKNSGVEPHDDFTTTTAIASATRLSETRIRRVCSMSAMISRNRQDRETWKLL